MSSGQHEPGQGNSGSTTSDGTAEAASVRLEWAGADWRGRSLHGAWWPRSRDAEAELTALVSALPDTLGSVSRIALSTRSWSDNPRRTARPGKRPVRVGWFSVVDPNVVTLVRVDGSRLRLLLVPPEAGADAAGDAMASATTDHLDQSPGELLVAAGVTEVPRPRSGDGVPVTTAT